MNSSLAFLRALLLSLVLASQALAAIVVEQPAGTGLTSGSSTSDFGSAVIGAPGSALTFTVRNTGPGTLSGLAVSVNGAAQLDYTVNAAGLPPSLAAGASGTFTVSFRPWQSGARAAALHIASSDAGSPFNVALTGTGLTQPGPGQSIVTAPPGSVKTGSAPFFLRAGTTSGLPLSYAVLTGPATISSGGLVTLTGVPGTVTVKISQAGGSGYNPTEAYVTFPVTMAGQEFVKLARGGASHSAGIRADGTLWAWGYNISGQVGDGTQTNRNSPVQVGTATNWAAVACGGAHTVALKNDGTLWAWGTSSALGDGSGLPRSSPVQVGNASDWATVAAGFSHTVAVKSDGTLWAWGSNGAGQVGDGTTAERYSPVRIGTASHWATVACGNNYSVAMGSDGTLWAWGNNFNGQLAVC